MRLGLAETKSCCVHERCFFVFDVYSFYIIYAGWILLGSVIGLLVTLSN